MTGCSIRKCKSRSVKGGSIMFFSIPRDQSLATEWLRHCGPKTTAKNGRVCSIHFLPSDYFKPLRHILLNISPKQGRKLKQDAIPTLHLDCIDKQNTPNVMITVKNEIIDTPENKNSLLQCNTISANEVGGSSKVYEKRPIEDIQNTPNVKVKIEIEATTENMNCLPQCNAIPANEVVVLSEVLEKRLTNDKQKPPNVTVEEENDIILTAENVNCLPQWHTIQTNTNTHTIPANKIAESSKVTNKSDETLTISLADHKALIRNTNELKALKHNLSKMFTSGQIRCLTNPTRRRIKWSAEDIAAALSLRRKSPQGYRFMRVTVGIPLPGCSTLRKWEAKHKMRKGLLENVVKIDHTYAE